MSRARRISEHLLPNGPADAARQVLLFVGAYVLYQLVRGLVNTDDIGRASENARRIIALERRLHVFVEPAVQRWALHSHALVDVLVWFYLNGNYAITGGALLWLYLRRNDSFYFVRNMFLIAMALALVGYTLYPTAPPRLMGQYGFVDVVQQVTGVDAERSTASDFVNLYAAVPSMHICFALMTSGSVIGLVRSRPLRVLWALYVPWVAFVVVATANHYLTDVVLGALTAVVAAVLSRELLARARPRAWALHPDRVEQTA